MCHVFLFPIIFYIMGNLKTAHVRPSVRPSVRPELYLRDALMDLNDTWYDDQPIPGEGARFTELKNLSSF